MITTTAALECQSKPNHMTMIGAMPMIGSAETKLPSGEEPALQERDAVGSDRHSEAGKPQPMSQPGISTALQEGLHEIGPIEAPAATRR